MLSSLGRLVCRCVLGNSPEVTIYGRKAGGREKNDHDAVLMEVYSVDPLGSSEGGKSFRVVPNGVSGPSLYNTGQLVIGCRLPQKGIDLE
jgi:hypothetical protein